MRVSVGDVRLFVDVEGPAFVADGPVVRERPTVLLLHGGPGFDHSVYKPAYSPLAEVAQLVYVDHRGHGRSDRGDPSRWTLDTWADDVVALCEALGIERPVVYGWSFGGVVAMAYAARHPGHPSKLVIQSSVARLDVDGIVEGFRREGGDEAAEAARLFWGDAGPDRLADYALHCMPHYNQSPPDLESMGRCVINPDLLSSFWAGEGRTMDLAPGLANVTCPTLVMVGEHDPVTSVAGAREIVAALPDGVGRLATFEKSGHDIATDEPEAFLRVLVDFLEGKS